MLFTSGFTFLLSPWLLVGLVVGLVAQVVLRAR